MFVPSSLYDTFGYYDEDRFVEISHTHGLVIRCVHPYPFVFDKPFDDSTQVVLKHYIHGWAGQCSTCGKVYYSDHDNRI